MCVYIYVHIALQKIYNKIGNGTELVNVYGNGIVLCRYLYRGQKWHRDAELRMQHREESCQILTFCDGENEMRYKVCRRGTG